MHSAVPLSADEHAVLPAIHPRWLAHVVAVVGACAGVAALVIGRQILDRLDPIVTGWALHWSLAIPLLAVTLAAPWVLISPVLFRVGYGWGTVALLIVFPLAAPFVGWALGFRLVRIPYRDWRPSARQRPTARPLPGTGYHVLQSDVDRSRPGRSMEPSPMA